MVKTPKGFTSHDSHYGNVDHIVSLANEREKLDNKQTIGYNDALDQLEQDLDNIGQPLQPSFSSSCLRP